MNFYIGQRVRVYPETMLLLECAGWAGTICSVEVEDGQWLYRVRLDSMRSESDGYLFYTHELKDCFRENGIHR